MQADAKSMAAKTGSAARSRTAKKGFEEKSVRIAMCALRTGSFGSDANFPWRRRGGRTKEIGFELVFVQACRLQILRLVVKRLRRAICAGVPTLPVQGLVGVGKGSNGAKVGNLQIGIRSGWLFASRSAECLRVISQIMDQLARFDTDGRLCRS